jgi:predicted permease
LFPFIRIAEDQRFFFFLQAVMPTAISLVIIGAYTKADNEFLSSVVFYSHLISVISIPLWFQIFAFVSGI